MITFTGGVYSITLPNPRLGDSEQLDLKTTFIMAMDSTVYSYLRTPTNSKYLLAFEDLTDTEYADFVTFIDNTVNEDIVYVDYNGDSFTGTLVSPVFSFESYGRRPCTTGEQEAHRVTVEFESSPPVS